MENCFRLIFQRPELFNGTLYLLSLPLSLSLSLPSPPPPPPLLIMIHTMKHGARSYFNSTWRVIVRSSRSKKWVKKLTVRNLKGLDGGKIHFIYRMFERAIYYARDYVYRKFFPPFVVTRKMGDEKNIYFEEQSKYNIDTTNDTDWLLFLSQVSISSYYSICYPRRKALCWWVKSIVQSR